MTLGCAYLRHACASRPRCRNPHAQVSRCLRVCTVGRYNCAPAHHAVTQFPTNYAHPAVGAGAGAGTGAGAGAGASPALANPPSFTGHPAGYPAAGGYSASPAAYGGGAPAYHPHPPSPSYGDGGGYNPSPSAAPAISVPYGYSGHGDGFGGGARRNSGSSVASGRLTPVYRPVSPAAGDAQPARPARYHVRHLATPLLGVGPATCTTCLHASPSCVDLTGCGAVQLTFTRPGPIGLTISESKPGAPFPAVRYLRCVACSYPRRAPCHFSWPVPARARVVAVRVGCRLSLRSASLHVAPQTLPPVT